MTVGSPSRGLRIPAFVAAAVCGIGLVAAAFLGVEGSARPAPESAPEAPRPTGAARAIQTSPTPPRVAASPARDRGVYFAPAGTELRFDYAVDTTYAMGSTGSTSAGEADLRYRGELVVAVVARDDEAIVVATRIEGLTFPGTGMPGNAPQIASQEAAARATTLIRLSHDGRVLGYRFDPSLTPRQRHFVRALHAPFAFTVPDDGPRTWESTEADATGEFVARYERLPANAKHEPGVRRIKIRYVAMGSAGDLPTHRVEGAAVARFSPEHGWISRASVDERMQMRIEPMNLSVRFHFRGRIRLRSVGAAQAPLAGPLVQGTGGEWAAAGGHVEDLGPTPQERRAALEAELAGVTMPDLLAGLEAVLAAGGYDSREAFELWDRLGKLVELRPELAARLAQEARRRADDPDLAGLLVTALGKARHEQAQNALAQLLADATLAPSVRQAVAVAAVQIAEPTAKLLDTLAASLERGTPLGPAEASSLLALGTLAGRTQQPLRGRPTVLDHLLGMEDRLRARGRQALWLQALGNSKDPRIVARVLPYLRDEHDGLRAAAVSALRDVPAPEASRALIERLGSDRSPLVRRRAVEALAERRDPEASGALLGALGDRDPGVRRAAILAVAGRRHPDPRARRRLQAIAEHDPIRDLRTLAKKVLTKS